VGRTVPSSIWGVELELALSLKNHTNNMVDSDEDDDYMNMVFEDAPKGRKYETALQRAARKRKEVRLSPIFLGTH
jgi:hypothetical protein